MFLKLILLITVRKYLLKFPERLLQMSSEMLYSFSLILLKKNSCWSLSLVGHLPKCFSIASMIASIGVLKTTKLTVSLTSPLTNEIKADCTVCSGHELSFLSPGISSAHTSLCLSQWVWILRIMAILMTSPVEVGELT